MSRRGRDDLAVEVGRWAERQPRVGHPTAERLEAYRRGTMSSESSRALQRHLALCERCTAWLLDAHADADPDDANDASEPLPVWQSLRRELAETGWLELDDPHAPGSWPRSPWLGAVAVSVLVVGGMAGWNLRSSGGATTPPRATSPSDSIAGAEAAVVVTRRIFDVGPVRGGTGLAATERLPDDLETLVIEVTVAGATAYACEVSGADGPVLLATRIDPGGASPFRLQLRRATLSEMGGRGVVRLWAETDGGRELRSEYAFEWQPAR